MPIETLLLACAALCSPAAAADEDAVWGHLQGRFLFDGEPPKIQMLEVRGLQPLLKTPVPAQSLVVNRRNKGIANILVYLIPDRDQPLAVHPSYAKSAKSKVLLTTHQGRLVPHIVLLQKGQVLRRENKDPFTYGLHVHFLRATPS